MTVIRKGYADTGSGEQIHFRHRSGNDPVPIVFLHQTASSGQMYLKCFERLDPRWECFALDTPGFGGSFDPDPQSRPAMSDYVNWIQEAITSLGIRRAHLVGHHTGACIAVEMAARYPDLVASLVMCGPVPLTPEERKEFSKHFGTPFTPVTSGSYLMDNWDYLRSLGAAADPILFHREMADMMRAWWGRVQSYNAVWDQDFVGFYKVTACPIMIMAAADDVLYPYLERAAEMRRDALVHPIAGANFEPDLDPDNFADGIGTFLRNLSSA